MESGTRFGVRRLEIVSLIFLSTVHFQLDLSMVLARNCDMGFASLRNGLSGSRKEEVRIQTLKLNTESVFYVFSASYPEAGLLLLNISVTGAYGSQYTLYSIYY